MARNPTPTNRARQGRPGRPVLMVLIAALVLLMIGWAFVEWYGESIDSSATMDPSVERNEAEPQQ